MLTYERNGRTYACDPNKLPAESIAYLLQYGWAQSLQDSIAGRAKKVKDECEADTEHPDRDAEAEIDADLDGTLSKRADAIMSGTMGQRESVSRDPFETMCNRVATEMLVKALRASKTTVKRDSDKWKELHKQVRDKYADSIETEAARRLESTDSIEIEI